MAKLSDAEFTERARASNRRRAERQRQRLVQSGKAPLTLWVPDGLRKALAARAANDGATMGDTAAALLASGLNATTTPVNSLPLFAAPAPVDRDSRILALKREQPDLSNYAIAARVGCSEPTVRRALKRLQVEATG